MIQQANDKNTVLEEKLNRLLNPRTPVGGSRNSASSGSFSLPTGIWFAHYLE